MKTIDNDTLALVAGGDNTARFGMLNDQQLKVNGNDNKGGFLNVQRQQNVLEQYSGESKTNISSKGKQFGLDLSGLL